MDTLNAIENVLSGNSAYGSQGAGKKISFPEDIGAKLALAQACEDIFSRINDHIDCRDDTNITSIISKLASFCTKKGWVTGQQIEKNLKKANPSIADALRESPALVNGKAGVAGILKAHFRKAQERSSKLRKERINNASSKPLEVLKAGDHILYELLIPEHLQEESKELEHCVGTSLNEELLNQKGIDKDDPDAKNYLTYAIKIRTGESRIFSLRDKNNKPVATIEVDNDWHRVSQIQGKPRQIETTAPFFKDLCEALYLLRDKVDISGGISGLPFGGENSLLNRKGEFVQYEVGIDFREILNDTIKIPPSLPEDEIKRLCAIKGLTLDVSDLSTDKLNQSLPRIISAQLWTQRKGTLHLNNVQEIGGLWDIGANKVELPELRKSGNILAYSAKSFEAPLLEKAKYIGVESVQKLQLPHLIVAQDIGVSNAEAVSLPKLKKVRDIGVNNAKHINIVSLRQLRHCWAEAAKSMVAQQGVIQNIDVPKNCVISNDPKYTPHP